ncbi:hypothetical protein EXS71_00170 [Candidatus Uhrbacteria bacterium]|nr:hypothetical protein [Candidatus Uhrbacteria bacterium]
MKINRSSIFFRAMQSVLIVMVVCVSLAGPSVEFALAQPENAPPVTGVGMPSAVMANLPETANSTYKTIISQITRALVVAFFNAAQLLVGRLAYEAANYIVSGGKGQGAQFFTKNFAKNMTDVGKDAVGEAMGSLSDSEFFKNIGFNLCKPNTSNLLKIQLSLGNFFPQSGVGQGQYSPQKPKCEFQNVINNWNSFGSSLTKAETYPTIDFNLNTNTSELGATVNILNSVTLKTTDAVSFATKEREVGKGFKDVSGIISGNVKTPSEVVSEATKEETVRKGNASQIAQTGAILGNAFKEGPIQLASYTASVFLNTLASKFMKRIFDKGFTGAFDYSDAVRQNVAANPDAIVTAGKTDARAANIDLKTPNLQKVAQVDVVSEFSGCPSDYRGLWNCTIDQKFIQAVQSQGEQGSFTVGEAMGKGFLDGSRRLIPTSMTKLNQDPNCFNTAYCAGNLQKLRLARILSVGFELAANSAENQALCNSSSGCATLSEVVKGFSVCNPQGQRDAKYPWCHLIDANWVITSFPQQCTLSGFGDTLLSPSINQRREECQDIQTCLKRNNQGECTGGYGYCMAEKTVYRFQAEECPARFSSCRNYQAPGGGAISYLRNTLDYGTCDASNVGCLWYATTRNALSTSTDAWVGTTSTGPRIYFDKTLAPCSGSDEGCTKVHSFQIGDSALNLIQNPSFENAVGTSTPTLANWSPGTPFTIPQVASGTASFDTASALELSLGKTIIQKMAITSGRMYTFSVYARGTKDGGNESFKAQIIQYTEKNLMIDKAATIKDFRSSGCEPAGLGVESVDLRAHPALTTDWRRYECSFLSAANARFAVMSLSQDDKNSPALLDALQLEEGELATPFASGLNASLPATFMKLAPEDLNCRGEGKDHPLCAKFAQVCRQSEAGCQGYTDVLAGGEVPAIVGTNDYCPETCVSYAQYRKQPSAFDLVHDSIKEFDDPTDTATDFFIPATAQACTQEQVGCEEFTNVEASAGGGERTAYYSYVRACEKPDKNSKTFFTWEGSDTAGFQLRSWSMKQDPNANVLPGEVAGGPLLLLKRGPDQVSFKDPKTCSEANWRSGVDPDCRQFYDADGHVFYRYYSQTVLSTDQCKDYRLNNRNIDDCKKTGGTFQASTGECVYSLFAPESRVCSAQAISCRAYAGAESGNMQTVLAQNFRDGIGAFVGGEKSSESLLVGDSSLRIPAKNKPQDKIVQASVSVTSTPTDLFRVTFWAKGPAATSSVPLFVSTADPKDLGKKTVVGTVNLTPDWQRYSVGPFNGWSGSKLTALVWSAATPLVYLDEVTVTLIPDMAYVRANTWKTPNECDTGLGGVPQPQAMLGCREYKRRDGQKVDIRQFSRLCRQQAISCTGFIDTRNSADTGEQTFVMEDKPVIPGFGGATTTRSADRYLYLIDDPSKHCQPENASCRAFGKPKYTQNRLSLDATSTFATVYYKDDITKYDQGLCRPSELFCQEFNPATGGKEYFRDPGNHTCEYKENVPLTGDNSGIKNLAVGTYSGWFEKGTTLPCYPLVLENGQTFNLLRTGDTEYQGWGGLCPQDQGECSELRDPNDVSDPSHKTGKPYFFIYDPQKFDTATCNGSVDVGKGCILLNNLSDTQLSYNVSASYAKYRDQLFTPTTPVSCLGSKDANCQAKKCQGQETIVTTNFLGVVDTKINPWEGNVCERDAECNYKIVDKEIINPVLLTHTHDFTGSCSKPGGTRENDANLLIKVNVDRDCSQWLGCKSAETVFDRSSNKYKDICTNLALCDQASHENGDIFCAHYVNRATTSTEPTLTRGAFFDVNQYASRRIGLGENDYSGYTIPNSFQVPDLTTAKPGADGAGNVANNKYRFALDYRLAAAIVIPVIVDPQNPNKFLLNPSPKSYEAIKLDKEDPLSKANPQLFLCKHVGTGRIGYYRLNEYLQALSSGRSFLCYVAVNAKDTGLDFQNVTLKFAQPNPTHDQALSQAFPSAECRAYPEADAPFPSSYAIDWDTSKNPAQPKQRLTSFTGANICEYGEDCACSYKRVEYPDAGIIKFYDVFSSHVLPGVCAGGPRAGQSCLPEAIFKIPQTDPKNPQKLAIEGSNASQTCGPPEQGGRCVAFRKSQIVNGIFGQCLERDMTRITGDDVTQHPCLTWNPTPILFGEKDPYHYVPTAGYFPPENSGQYYCLSKADPPSARSLTDVDFVGEHDEKKQNEGKPDSNYAGSMFKFNYDDNFTSNGRDSAVGGYPGASLVGDRPEFSPNAEQCELADDDQDEGDNDRDLSAVRLVDAGSSPDQSYTETFFQLEKPILEFNGGDNKDKSLAYISISPIENPNDMGRLACGYQADWVDGLGEVDYNEGDSTKAKDVEWRQKFFENYKPILGRGADTLFKGSQGQPLEVDCVNEPGKCFMKTWQTDYRSSGQTNFISLFKDSLKPFDPPDASSVKRQLSHIRSTAYTEKCTSDKPYFSIRGVFQSKAVNGPWSLQGFWVSTCGGQANDMRYIYMNIKVNYGSICTQLAEVISRDSRQNAAFTDRVWKNGNFTAPGVGFQYGSRFAPFSSALNTGPAGTDPLFQSGGNVAGFSSLKPPTFLGAGIGSFFRKETCCKVPDPNDPKGFVELNVPPYGRSWHYLTNLFAKIYRIYQWTGTEYQPDIKQCPDPSDESCGLTVYNFTKNINGKQEGLDPFLSDNLPPTNVTPGHYTPQFLGYDPIPADVPRIQQFTDTIAYYTPHPPRIAAPDARKCDTPGQCSIQRLDMFSFDGQSDGAVNAAGGQHKASLKFYGWASHEQMPLKNVTVDWGDGFQQKIADASLKNHKPFCATQSECDDPIRGWGITCNTDVDCPAGAGRCAPLGTCSKKQYKTCHSDSDCTIGKAKDQCIYRTFFGNSGEACQPNYFEFSHQYYCGGTGDLPACEFEWPVNQQQEPKKFLEGRCSRDPNRGCTTPQQEIGNIPLRCAAGDICIPTGLAPNRGCWDKKVNACRFTPRVMLQDNWGWCSGECRTKIKDNQLQDDGSDNEVLHPYGGCYSWGLADGIREGTIKSTNEVRATFGRLLNNECNSTNPDFQSLNSGYTQNYRPWIVYPGSLQLRSSGELQTQEDENLKSKTPQPGPNCSAYKKPNCPIGCVNTDVNNPYCGLRNCKEYSAPHCPVGCVIFNDICAETIG